MEISGFSEEDSFEDLYNKYYLLQMHENEVPLMKTFSKLQQGVMEKLNPETQKKLLSGKKNLFIGEGNLKTVAIRNKESLENKIETDSKKIGEEISYLKKIIGKKVLNFVNSDDFLVNLDISYGSEDYNSPKEDVNESLFMKFKALSPEDALGLYYVVHDDVPQTEFFKNQYGFALKISEFPEIENKINSIRELHGIQKPRNLFWTIEERGRSEGNERKKNNLLYAISGEKEIYDYLNGYFKLNFKFPARSFQGILLPLKEGFVKSSFEYGKRIVERGNPEKDIKNKWGYVWTGDMKLDLSREKNCHGKENNFLQDERILGYQGFSDGGDQSDFIERICAFCIDKFVEKNLQDKLKIDFSKKYY